MQHDAWFFIGIFIFIFLIWIATGGPTHQIAFTGPTLAQPQELGGGTYLSLPRAPYGIGGGGGTSVSLPGSTGGAPLGGGYSLSQTNTPSLSGVSFGSPSPYRGIVSMSHYVSGAGSSDPNREWITITVASNAQTPVDLTGWTLQSEATGNAITIPKGTGTPTSGIVNSVADITLLPGERAYVVSGRSPIGGSFRENKCIGYFSQFQNFSPSLPKNCPTPQNELMSSYPDYIRDSACIDYVKTLSRCEAVLTPPVTVSGTCQSFLVNRLNYNGCVSAHESDSDFLSKTWHIYLGRTNAMWRTKNEVVKLIDTQGKTVDAFAY